MSQTNPVLRTETDIYQSLALIYDALMQDINYEYWSDFIDAVIQTHHPDAETVLELACGTGSFALSLDELACYDIMATDQSGKMIEVAKNKASAIPNNVFFQQMDFTNISITETFDIVLMLFDSINYMLKDDDIVKVFNQVKQLLNPVGFFIFDFTTPSNSEKAEKLLNEQGVSENGYEFERISRYDKSEGIHYNEFVIEKIKEDPNSAPERYHELHKQRVYTLPHMIDIIEKSELKIVAKYDALDIFEADENSDRITMVLR
ncbi:MAG TPA: class I SAM-dependent methyltransferase [Balneolales bacterium]|nr:class I SAM-dependent methyltransferase [Balneolales bacterium]